MALRVLMLRKKLGEKQTALEELRTVAETFHTRDAELEQSIDEAKTEEENQVVMDAITQLENDQKENMAASGKLESEIKDIEKEIEELERKKPAPPAPESERKEHNNMETRTFFGMSGQQRDAFFARGDVKDFLQRARDLVQQKRAVNGSELLIPNVMLDLVRENISKYSKLIKYVNLRSVPGKARQNIMGTIPAAVWTEMCGKLNELNLTFNQVEVDGYKVGGYIAVCNATLEDSDIALASEIISALGQAIGYALDKAIIYGKGIKMPLGYVTRLAQAAEPSDYPAKTRPWVDLHLTNIKTIAGSNTGVKLFQEIVKASGAAKGRYSAGTKFWAMNDTTYTTLMAEAMSINAAGAIVSGQLMTMPVVGGAIEILDFIPDNNIVGGYGDLYLLAERAGTTIAQSEHVRFLEDQTVFKGTARYDGIPAISEGFVAIGIGGTAPTTAIDFEPDDANTVDESGT